MGEVREISITKAKIADILQARRDFDEALRIYKEEELPVFEGLGEVRLIAITKGRIADILQARGDPDEAVTLWRKVIETLEILGDRQSIIYANVRLAMCLSERSLVASSSPEINQLLGDALTNALRMKLPGDCRLVLGSWEKTGLLNKDSLPELNHDDREFLASLWNFAGW